jgi:hypothetical protein
MVWLSLINPDIWGTRRLSPITFQRHRQWKHEQFSRLNLTDLLSASSGTVHILPVLRNGFCHFWMRNDHPFETRLLGFRQILGPSRLFPGKDRCNLISFADSTLDSRSFCWYIDICPPRIRRSTSDRPVKRVRTSQYHPKSPYCWRGAAWLKNPAHQ